MRWLGAGWGARGHGRAGRGTAGLDAAALARADARSTAATCGSSRWRRRTPRRSSPPNRVDDAIWDYLPYGPFADEADYRAWVDAVAGKPDPLFFALTDRGGRRAGRGGEPDADHARRRARSRSATSASSPSLQRTRAASEMIFLLADWVFREGYRRFEWKCDALNRPSRRAAQRFGFSFEGVFRQHMVVKGRNRDTAWFAMTDGDWRCLRPAWEAWLDPANFDADGPAAAALGDLTAPLPRRFGLRRRDAATRRDPALAAALEGRLGRRPRRRRARGAMRRSTC